MHVPQVRSSSPGPILDYAPKHTGDTFCRILRISLASPNSAQVAPAMNTLEASGRAKAATAATRRLEHHDKTKRSNVYAHQSLPHPSTLHPSKPSRPERRNGRKYMHPNHVRLSAPRLTRATIAPLRGIPDTSPSSLHTVIDYEHTWLFSLGTFPPQKLFAHTRHPLT